MFPFGSPQSVGGRIGDRHPLKKHGSTERVIERSRGRAERGREGSMYNSNTSNSSNSINQKNDHETNTCNGDCAHMVRT